MNLILVLGWAGERLARGTKGGLDWTMKAVGCICEEYIGYLRTDLYITI
jgi:hypothetical protein